MSHLGWRCRAWVKISVCAPLMGLEGFGEKRDGEGEWAYTEVRNWPRSLSASCSAVHTSPMLMFSVGGQGALLQGDRGATILWYCHLNMWLPEPSCSPALNCLHPEVMHTSFAHNPQSRSSQWFQLQASGKCQVSMEYLASTSICATERVLDSQDTWSCLSWKSFRSDTLQEGHLRFHLSGQSERRMMMVSKGYVRAR